MVVAFETSGNKLNANQQEIFYYMLSLFNIISITAFSGELKATQEATIGKFQFNPRFDAPGAKPVPNLI